ncbi:MAG: hypothetical protein ACT4NL_00400 [Pseudomarimonas sp.]
MPKQFWWLIGLCLLGFVYRVGQPGPLFPPSQIPQAAGRVIAPDPPIQRLISNATPQTYLDLELQPLAEFEFDARLLSLAWYSQGTEANYSPVDLGIAWGAMSDSANIDALDWSHGSRFLNYRYASQPPIPQRELDRSVANLHVLPASAEVLRKIEQLRAGQRIVGRGILVAATRADGWRWNSSLSREDTGAGACELLLLSDISVR